MSSRKGKGRAVDLEPTETTPLIQSTSTSPESAATTLEPAPSSSHGPRILRGFCIGLALSIAFSIALALMAIHRLRRDVKLDEAVRWQLNHLEVLNVTEQSMSLWVKLSASFWVDVEDLPLWEKRLLAFGLRTIDIVTTDPSIISVYSSLNDSRLLSISTPELTFHVPDSSLDIRNADIIFQAIPTTDFSYLLELAERSWNASRLDTIAVADDITFRLDSGWAGRFTLPQIQLPFTFEVPKFPFLPPPPSALLPGIAAALELSSMQVYPNRTVFAQATIPNPFPYFHLPPFSISVMPDIPGSVYLPPLKGDPKSQDLLPVVTASPESINISSYSHNLTIPMRGTLLSIPSSLTAEKQLSSFFSTYLSGEDSPVVISILGKYLEYNFPAPKPKPKVLQHVELSDMKISYKEKTAVVSGKLQVIVALPKGVDLTLDVKRATVDLLAYDGPVEDATPSPESILPKFPWPFPFPYPTELPGLPRVHLPFHRHPTTDEGIPSPPPHALPDPLPPNAFARIRPEEWLNATSIPTGPPETDPEQLEETMGSHYEVTAFFHHVPLELLPGREAVFRSFVAKFLFHKEALAGVKGFAGVGVIVPGLISNNSGVYVHEMGVLELLDLPFDGSVLIAKGKFL